MKVGRMIISRNYLSELLHLPKGTHIIGVGIEDNLATVVVEHQDLADQHTGPYNMMPEVCPEVPYDENCPTCGQARIRRDLIKWPKKP